MKKINISSIQLKGVSVVFVLLLFIVGACETRKSQNKNKEVQNEKNVGKIENGNIVVKYNDMMFSKVISKKEEVPLMDDFKASEYIRIDSVDIKKFSVEKHFTDSFEDSLGAGNKLILIGNSINKKYPIQKRLVVKAYNRFPNMIITQVSYKNMGNNNFKINKWVNNNYQIANQYPDDKSKTAFWSYQSGTYATRNDWIRPIKDGYHQENYMGMNASDYGGGTPVTDIWRRDVGLAVGNISMVPRLVSLPVSAQDVKDGVHLSIEYDFSNISQKKISHIIRPGQSLRTLKTFVLTHTGDFFRALQEYSDLMQARGMKFPKSVASDYQPIWCAWGYGRNMHLQQVLNTVPVAKELGFKWVVLDDGWQKAEGSWVPNSKFQNMSMKEFVQKIHNMGMKAKLWWAPMSADAGSSIFQKHPEYLIINKKGNLQHISWWNSYYLNPADPGVVNHAKKMVNKFMNRWGFDGLKIDGQFLNQVPPNYNSVGNLKYPEKSVEKLPDYFKTICNTATKADKNAVVEICPCGTAASFYIMSAMNQPVASDPKSSWQVRQRGKVYKALMGPRVPFYGDHVELSDNQSDFASTIGIGGVPGSKFTIKEEAPEGSYGYKYALTPEKKKTWKKWLSIYNGNMLSKGKYLGTLYDIGFGKPEGHAIFKNGNVYYAFYVRQGDDKQWDGKIHLNGLKKNKKYKIIDYVNDKRYGTVSGPDATIKAKFQKHLLLKAKPITTN